MDLPIALMQGAYMDRDRGAAEVARGIAWDEGVRLVLVGAGVEWDEASRRVNEPSMEGRLHCTAALRL